MMHLLKNMTLWLNLLKLAVKMQIEKMRLK